MGRWLYLDFLTLVEDYFSTLKFREVSFDWGIPAVFSAFTYLAFSLSGSQTGISKDLAGQVLDILGILFGFSIASLTLLITSNSENISEMQNTPTYNRRVSGRPINLYELTVITFTFVLLTEMSGILLNFIYILAASLSEAFRLLTWKFFYTLDCFLMVQVVALNLRNTANIYFVFLKVSKKRAK